MSINHIKYNILSGLQKSEHGIHQRWKLAMSNISYWGPTMQYYLHTDHCIDIVFSGTHKLSFIQLTCLLTNRSYIIANGFREW